jgi:pullulanase/glycogen debranching enzyme
MTIGEGWIMDTELAPELLASQSNADELPGIGHFNDGFRDAVKGNIFRYEEPGFIGGKQGLEQAVKTGITGGVVYGQSTGQFADEPQQCVNFVECHDNHTLWDKIVLSSEGESDKHREDMHRLASAMVLTSQGIPFLHAGQEFMRTKDGVENSYKSSVEINRMDWERCADHTGDVAYMKRLIALRKAHPAFRLRTAEEIRAKLMFEKAPAGAVAYTLRSHAGGDPAEHLYVLYNSDPDVASLSLPALGEWTVLFGDELVSKLAGGKLTVKGLGMVVLAVQP